MRVTSVTEKTDNFKQMKWLSRGVIGNTSDFGSEESKFEPWRDNWKSMSYNEFCDSFFCAPDFTPAYGVNLRLFLNKWIKTFNTFYQN